MSNSNKIRLDVEGIAAIEVKLAEGKVIVDHDPALATEAQMIEALAEAGYEARAEGA